MIQQSLQNALEKSGIERDVVTVCDAGPGGPARSCDARADQADWPHTGADHARTLARDLGWTVSTGKTAVGWSLRRFRRHR
jgi:hypothetical protein